MSNSIDRKINRPNWGGRPNPVDFDFSVAISLLLVLQCYFLRINLPHLRKTRPRVCWNIRIHRLIGRIVQINVRHIKILGDPNTIRQRYHISVIINLLDNLVWAIFLGLQLAISAHINLSLRRNTMTWSPMANTYFIRCLSFAIELGCNNPLWYQLMQRVCVKNQASKKHVQLRRKYTRITWNCGKISKISWKFNNRWRLKHQTTLNKIKKALTAITIKPSLKIWK